MDENFKISQIISKFILTSSKPAEDDELDLWLKSKSYNLEFYKHITQEGLISNKLDEYRKVNVKKAWQQIESNLEFSPKTQLWPQVLRWASILIIPLIAGALIFNLYEPPKEDITGYLQSEVMPGSSQAILILSDGTKVELKNGNQYLVLDKAGAEIENEGNQLRYKVKNDTEIKDDKIVFNELHIPIGGEYKLVLEDGTKIWLNSATTLKYPSRFSGQKREVYLEGEAYFEVVSSPDYPFEVHTSKMTMHVVGTSFNVMAYKDEAIIQTTLVEGKVNLNSKLVDLEGFVLHPGQQSVMDVVAKQMEVKMVDPYVYTAWKDGLFMFYNEDLGSITRKLSRWYNIDIEFETSSTKNMRFYGKIKRYETIDKILEMIKITEKIDYTIKGKSILITTKK